MVVELGMNNNNDLEALTPGLQIGHQSPDSGHGNHLYLRGIGSQRNQEFFQATAVATYVDGIYTDEIYGLEPGNLFDVESMNVARGPQGTTGGRAAIAGAISFNTIKPTAQFDVNALAEYTDQTSQRGDLAIGGPIGDSRVSWAADCGKLAGRRRASRTSAPAATTTNRTTPIGRPSSAISARPSTSTFATPGARTAARPAPRSN